MRTNMRLLLLRYVPSFSTLTVCWRREAITVLKQLPARKIPRSGPRLLAIQERVVSKCSDSVGQDRGNVVTRNKKRDKKQIDKSESEEMARKRSR
jgi:hypothetical protein